MVFIKAAINKIWFNLIRYTSKVLFILLYGMKVYGKENLSKDRGPLLLVCNHQSFFDPVFAQSVFNRELNFVARDSLFDNKFLGALITSLHTIPIKRGEGDITAMRKVIKNLKENKAVCLFPEGTRSPDGKIGEIKEALRTAVTGLNDLTACLKATQRQQRQTDKEIRTVRQTIRSLRKVEL
jgi:1-acyl-sn-glycerol-3-phosphate acyltransferase